MAVSGSVNYSDSLLTIITDTLIHLSVLGKDKQPSAYDTQLCTRWLNRMIKSWMTMGLQLWATTEAGIFVQYNQTTYNFGATGNIPGGSHASNTYVSTTLSAAALINATSLVLTTVTGLTVGDNIGIHINDTHGTRFWTTISTINTGTLTVTIPATGLTAAASSGATVITYTTKLNRPMDVYTSTFSNLTANSDIRMEKISRDAYMVLPNKSSLGTQLQYYYDPQLVTGVLYLWPTPTDVDTIVKMSYLRPLDDFDALSDTPDLPIEWNTAIITNLAVLIAPSYGKIDKIKDLQGIAAMYLKEAMDWDNERVSIQLQPSYIAYRED